MKISVLPEKEKYEETRVRLRYGVFQSTIMVVTTTIGLSIFTYQFAFGKVKKSEKTKN